MTAIRIEQLTKSYGKTVVVDDVSMSIRGGELFFLLGPSGCGKTTLLRSLAGFVRPEQGRIYFDDRLINDVPPRDRGTGMVFQNYALWPHMTVAQNIAFGLEVRGVPAAERARRVQEAVALVRLDGLERSRPTQLSGGQQQRVALARAVVVRPHVLLLDEPLSNLDARLRAEMREEIRRVHSQTGLTTVYVTHDQKEALSLADRMAVMHRGQVIQVDTPRQCYLRPCNVFVANFLGDANLFDGRVVERNGEQLRVHTDIGVFEGTAERRYEVGSRVVCCVRPESIEPDESVRGGTNRIRATVERELFLGDVSHLFARAGDRVIACHRATRSAGSIAAGREIDCVVAAKDVVILPPE